MRVTRPIGTKMRCRCASSTTRPSTRGGCRSTRSIVTASRTLPSWSPLGSKTSMPASRARKTAVAGAHRGHAHVSRLARVDRSRVLETSDRSARGRRSGLAGMLGRHDRMTESLRPRRSCLAVPGSNPRFLEKAKGLAADQVFLDLEDACAPLAKPERAQEHRRRAERGRLGRQDPRRPGQRLDDALDLPRRRRGRRGRRRRTSTASCCRRCRAPSRSSRWTCC